MAGSTRPRMAATDDLPADSKGQMAVVHLMRLKKSLTVFLARFSEVFLPLTDSRERFVGRSERSIFSAGARERRATSFSTQ
jgi:hypothetical protein